MAQGGSIWSLSGPHSQDDRPERRHSTWRLKRRRGEHDKHMFLSNSCIMIHKHTILTISWHHTQRLPAKVLIFLWQIWHLLDLQSALIQSWDATWDTEEQKQGWCPTTATFFFFQVLLYFSSIIIFNMFTPIQQKWLQYRALVSSFCAMSGQVLRCKYNSAEQCSCLPLWC